MNESKKLALGVDIGGTNTKIGVFNLEGDLLHFEKIPTNKDISAEEFVKQITQHSLPHLKNGTLVGAGVGAPMANFETGMIDHAPNLNWTNVPLKKLFEENFKVPCILENDANLAAIGELRWGAGKELKHFIMVTLGTGVGTGVIVNHKLHRGHLALGGEGGHVLIPHSQSRKCSCGGLNHLESYLSAEGIKQTLKDVLQNDWTLEKLSEEFKKGSSEATQVIDVISQELANGLVSMGVLLGPEAFILGGGVSQLGSKFNLFVKEKMDAQIHFSLRGKIQILSASLSSSQGAVYGGAAIVFEEVL